MNIPAQDFQKVFDSWLQSCEQIIIEHQQKNYPDAIIGLSLKGELWLKTYLRVLKCYGPNRFIYAFVVLEDFTSKKFGNFKCGDILKPDNQRYPTGLIKGNIFDEYNGLQNMDHSGVKLSNPEKSRRYRFLHQRGKK